MGFRGRVLSAGLSQLGRQGLEALHRVLPSEYDWSEGEGERMGWNEGEGGEREGRDGEGQGRRGRRGTAGSVHFPKGIVWACIAVSGGTWFKCGSVCTLCGSIHCIYLYH